MGDRSIFVLHYKNRRVGDMYFIFCTKKTLIEMDYFVYKIK